MHPVQSVGKLLAFGALLLANWAAAAAPWAGILDSSRAVDWGSFVGIPGGIPKRTNICTTLSASTFGNGSSDATSAIQSALNSCAADGVVLLSAGVFRINGTFNIPSRVSLRGAGPDKTTLSLFDSSRRARITLGNGGPSGPISTAIVGSPVSGSTSISVSSSSGIAVGTYLLVTQLNDASLPVTTAGGGGNCTWCGDFFGAERSMGQIVEVTSVSGTTLGIFPPLFTNYKSALAPQVNPFQMQKYSGIENVKVYANNTIKDPSMSPNTSNITLSACAYCWVKNVEGDYADGDHVRAFYSFRGEIRDSYFHDGFNHMPGQSEATIFIALKTTGFLIENNILRRQHISVLFDWGPAGNVTAYNFMEGSYDSRAAFQDMYLMGSNTMHGAHPSFNLFEGNVEPEIWFDAYWGSSSHNTVFRSHLKGTTRVCLPITDNQRAPETTTCRLVASSARAVAVEGLSRYFNSVGNVISSADQLTLYSSANIIPLLVSPTYRSWSGQAYGYTFGYPDSGSSGTTSSTANNHPTFTTALIAGDFNRIKGQIFYACNGASSWTSSLTSPLPPSFFRTSKPAWFGSVPWPPIGADVNGGTEAGHVHAIPAELCFKNTPRATDGTLRFNADNCYSTTAPPSAVPTAPTNLRVQ